MKLYIYLFRHGQTTYNERGWFTGCRDAKMTNAGYQNARTIARKLQNKKIDVAYRSHLSRSKETLKEVLPFHPECREIIEDDRIIERCYGTLEGRSHRSFLEEVKRKVLVAVEKKYGKLEKHSRRKFGEEVAQQIFNAVHRSYDIPPPDGESLKTVEKRVRLFIKDLLKKMKKEHISVAISAHGNSMRPFRRYFEKLSVEEMLRLENPYDRYFSYVIHV
ncbi:MAG: histidine phosphatase family protein [Nanoarchaeota archaeon]|nr:histidine phosphatase family protein [Nanoarchaeota archaeon]